MHHGVESGFHRRHRSGFKRKGLRMTNWHYTENGQQRGPISVDELKGKIAAGELTGMSLVWQVGTKEWSEVRNFPELVGQVQTPPPLPASVTVVAGTKTAFTALIDSLPVLIPLLSILLIAVALVLPMEASPRYKEYKVGEWIGIASVAFVAVAIALAFLLQPKCSVSPPSFAWKRCFAKVLDWGLAALAGSIAVAFFGPTKWQSMLPTYFGVYLAVWFLFEVPMKCRTLGRELFGVRVQGPTSANYLFRFVNLNIFGMAFWIPVLSYFAHLLAYKRLRETGTTIWDGNEFTVVDDHAGVGRLVFGVLLIGTLFGVQGAVLKSAGKAAETSRSSESKSSSAAPLSAAVSEQPEALVSDSPQRVSPKPTPGKPKTYTYEFDYKGQTYEFDHTSDDLTPEQIQGIAPQIVERVNNSYMFGISVDEYTQRDAKANVSCKKLLSASVPVTKYVHCINSILLGIGSAEYDRRDEILGHEVERNQLRSKSDEEKRRCYRAIMAEGKSNC